MTDSAVTKTRGRKAISKFPFAVEEGFAIIEQPEDRQLTRSNPASHECIGRGVVPLYTGWKAKEEEGSCDVL